MEIYKKLLEVQKEVGKMTKDKTAQAGSFQYKYFDINQIIDMVNPVLSKHGLLLMQPIEEGHQISMIIDAESGDKVVSALELPKLNDPQKLGSVVTYYRRYTLCSLLALQSQDDDANIASEESKELPNLQEGSVAYKQVVKALSDKSATMDYVKKKFTLTKEIEEKLKAV